MRIAIRLIRDGIKIAECESCRATNWLSGSVPLELHHINGDRFDNRLENLQLLCPNCHALTNNHAGKAHKILKPNLKAIEVTQSLDESETNNRFVSTLVFDSAESRDRWNKIPLGLRQLGVSDKAIEKWCKAYEIEKPPRGYWAKKQHGKI